jgi:HAD superfamily hydrolase (TIGR01509 family)
MFTFDIVNVYDTEGMGIYWPLGLRPTVNPRALIFDMDGVIVDSEALHESAKQQALRSAGIDVDESLLAQYTGRSDRAMITDLARAHGRSDDEVEAILLETQRLYTLGEPQLRPISGAIEFLDWALKHYRLAIATSATPRNRTSTLANLRLAEVFDVAVDSASVIHAKPSPEIFLRAIAGLGLPAEDCWVIEDSVNGIVAARHALCFAVGLTTSFHQSQLLSEGANLVVDRFSELRELLQSMAARPGGEPL